MDNITKIILSFLVLSGILFVSSCSKRESLLPNDDYMAQTNPHTIPLETALSNLQDFLGILDSTDTKVAGSLARKVGNVFTVNTSRFATKSVASDVDLVYVVNFEDENGYAIIAADDRITSDVISVVESGSLTEGILRIWYIYLGGADVEYDGNHSDQTDYNWYLKIITYDKPS